MILSLYSSSLFCFCWGTLKSQTAQLQEKLKNTEMDLTRGEEKINILTSQKETLSGQMKDLEVSLN